MSARRGCAKPSSCGKVKNKIRKTRTLTATTGYCDPYGLYSYGLYSYGLYSYGDDWVLRSFPTLPRPLSQTVQLRCGLRALPFALSSFSVCGRLCSRTRQAVIIRHLA